MASSSTPFGNFDLAAINAINDGLKKLKDSFSDTSTSIGKMADSMKNAFASAQITMVGFATAGFRGTVEGERLAFQMQQLSREIAGVFMPAMEKLIGWVKQAVQWFRNLSGEQQDNIMKWALWTAGITAAAKALQMFGLLTPLVSLAIKGIGLALWHMMGVLMSIKGLIITAFATSPILAAVAAIAVLTAAVIALAHAFSGASEAGEQLSKNMKDIQNQGLSQEDIDNSSLAQMSQMDDFKGASKEDKLRMIDEQTAAADEKLRKQKELANKTFDPAAARGESQKNALNAMMQSQKDLEILQRMREQVDKSGGVDMAKLAGGGKGGHRRPTDLAGGFEGLTSTYQRIQESAMKTFDPQQAHNEMKDLANRQIDKLDQVARGVEQVNVGARA